MTIEYDPIRFRKALSQQTPELVRQVSDPIIMHPSLCNFAGCPKAHDQERALGPGAPAALLGAAVQQRLQRHSLPQVKRSHTLWRIQFVARDAQKVHCQRLNIDRNLADRLGGVRVREHSPLAGDLGNLCNRLQRPHFVVCVHHRNQHGLRANRAANIVGVN